MVEEVAVSSRVLEEQAKELEHLISFYSVTDDQGQPLAPASRQAQAERRSENRPWDGAKKVPENIATTTAVDDGQVWESFG
jgi:hypothetical protein